MNQRALPAQELINMIKSVVCAYDFKINAP